MLKAVEENQYLFQLIRQKTFDEHCNDGWRGSINQLNERHAFNDLYRYL